MLDRNFVLPKELQELTSRKQWVCREGKIPKNPNLDGSNAKSNDSSTWSDYDTALFACMRNFSYDGVGIEFGVHESGLRVAGIDLDHVVQEDGKLSPIAKEIVETMNSYTEYSPSETGLHILCYVDLPAIGNKKNLENGQAIEMYNHGRYFTITGKVYGEGRAIANRTEEFKKLHEKYFSKPEPISQPSTILRQSSPIQSTVSTVNNLTDSELLSKMFSSRNGYEIQKLWNGDISSYGNDDSRADLALIQHLLFWTGDDEVRADNLFRQSRLMREKWNRADYRNRTIEAARSSQLGVYEPTYAKSTVFDNRTQSTNASATSSNASTLTASTPESSSTATEQLFDDVLLPVITLETYLQDGGGCDQDYEKFMKSKEVKTGFSNLDEQIDNLYPGLYVLGAISSLGKTTFACQLSDQLAQQGVHVLYFSLEQSTYELAAKGLSRLMADASYQLSRKNGTLPFPGTMTAMEIRRNMQNPLVKGLRAKYREYASNEVIYKCGFDTTITTIITNVNHYIKTFNEKPVVIVDYLQVVRPSDSRMNTKDAVDNNIRALKMLSEDNDLTVLVISSLNRQNYLTPVDFESFKETGGIEFTADVIWGLQLSVMNEESFEKEKTLQGKREKVKEAKKASPRKIELVCLKNRFGISSYTCKFDYYAQYDYFVPILDIFPSSWIQELPQI